MKRTDLTNGTSFTVVILQMQNQLNIVKFLLNTYIYRYITVALGKFINEVMDVLKKVLGITL